MCSGKSGSACLELGATRKPDCSLQQESSQPGAEFDTCLSEPGPCTAPNAELDAINTLLSELSDVESLTVISPGSEPEAVPTVHPAGSASREVQRKRYATLSDYSKHLRPQPPSSSRAFVRRPSVAAELSTVSCAGRRPKSATNTSGRPCSADLYALPKLACAPLPSNMYGSVMLSDDEPDDRDAGLHKMSSVAPTSGEDSLFGTFRPVTSNSDVSRCPTSCNFLAPVPPHSAAEDSTYDNKPASRAHQRQVCLEGPEANSGCSEDTLPAVPVPVKQVQTESTMEALILRMGAAVGTMSALGRADSSSSMLSTVPEVQQRQQILLQQCVEVMESFLQPEAACGPIDSDMASMQHDPSTLGSKMHSRHIYSLMRDTVSQGKPCSCERTSHHALHPSCCTL